MNKLIVLAAITLVSCGNVHSCNSTYYTKNKTAIDQQYNNTIDYSNQKYVEARQKFIDTARLTTNELSSMINKEEFKFVSVNDKSTYV